MGDWMKRLGSVRKPVVLLIALAIFVLVVALYIAPQQGGNNSSTDLQKDELGKADPKYQEQMPIQDVGLGSSGRSIFIAFAMLSHVVLANLHLGGSWVAVGSESVYLRNKAREGSERFKRIAKSITLFNLILFSAGATLAIAGVLFFMSLFPQFASYAFHIYWWPLLIEAFAFAFEIMFLYAYWFSWDKIKPRWHQVLGYAYAADVFVQTLMINTIASGMLTPGKGSIVFGSSGLSLMSGGDYFSWWFNATTWQLQFHRLFAAISFFGFLLAMISVLHYLDREDKASKRYWDWVGSYGIGIGLFGLLMQPILGVLYMSAIMEHQPVAFTSIMIGPRAWEILLMVGLLSALLLACISYFIDRRERILLLAKFGTVKKIFTASLVGAAIFGFILAQPAWLGATYRFSPGAWVNPLGSMSLKFVSLFGLVAIGGILVMIDTLVLRNEKESEWGMLSSASRSSAMLAGMLGMWIVIVMGFVRESARSPWTIFSIIPVPGGQENPTPIPLPQIFVVWALILSLSMVVFWYVSKVTSYHPEEAEKI